MRKNGYFSGSLNFNSSVSENNLNFFSIVSPTFEIFYRNMLFSINYQHVFMFPREADYVYQQTNSTIFHSTSHFEQEGKIYTIIKLFMVYFINIILITNASALYKTIDLHSNCIDIEVSSKTSIGYIACSCNCIIMFDFSKPYPENIGQINLPSNLQNFCDSNILKINDITNELYVIVPETNNLYIIDLSQTEKFIENPDYGKFTTRTVGMFPNNIALTPDGNTVFVCSDYSGYEEITIIDAKTKDVLKIIDFKNHDPKDMAFANNKLYVLDGYKHNPYVNDSVHVIDIESYSIIKTIQVEKNTYDAITGINESFLYISHDGPEGKISIINTETDKVVKTISLGKNTKEMAIDNNILYALNDNNISMINILTNELIKCTSQELIKCPYQSNVSKSLSSLDGKLYIVDKYEKKLIIEDIPFLCPKFKDNLNMEIKNDIGKITYLVFESEICENLPLTLTISVDNPDLFDSKPVLSQKGYISFTTNKMRYGSTTITMTVNDGKCYTKKKFEIDLIPSGPTLRLNKIGKGEIEIDDGYFETCLPCSQLISECNEPCRVLADNYTCVFPEGSTITLTAIPYKYLTEVWYFKNWSGPKIETTNSIKFELNREETSITANFDDEYSPVGYAIIIQARQENKEGEQAHRNTTDFVYDTFKKRGFMEEDIKYLRYNNENDKFWEPTIDKIKNAITNWALDKMNAYPSDLYIVIVGHGGKEELFFDKETLSSENLKDWVNVFNNDSHGNIIIVLGACHSGSFINELSGSKHIIITSSGEDEYSNKGIDFVSDNIKPDNMKQEGDYFIYHFFNSAKYGESIRECFKESSLATSKYFDSQYPLLDDNHDGKGTFDLLKELNGEGANSNEILIGNGLNNDNSIAKFLLLSPIFLEHDSSIASFTLDLKKCDRFDKFWIDVKSKTKKTDSNLKAIPKALIAPSESNLTKAHWDNITKFINPGKYQVLFFGKEKSSNHVLLLREQLVYKKNMKIILQRIVQKLITIKK